MPLIWMVITISEKTIRRRGHYLISRRLNRAVKILGNNLMNPLPR
jgi:hypothetical protein